MTFDAMLCKVLEIFPDAVVDQEIDGNLVINTRTQLGGDTSKEGGEIVPCEEDEGEDDNG